MGLKNFFAPFFQTGQLIAQGISNFQKLSIYNERKQSCVKNFKP